MYKMKGRALAAIKKERKKRLSKGKWVQKKSGGTESEARYRPRPFLDTILLHRPQSARPFPRASPRFPKEKENSKRKGNRAADEDTKDKE
jgi:hypothetical protein